MAATDPALDAEEEVLSASVRELVIEEVISETADAKSIAFAYPGETDAKRDFEYRPGQFLTLRLPSDRGAAVARCYSLSSSPHLDDRLVITVKRTAGGYASNWICDNARPGMRLHVLRPGGVFTPKSFDEDLLLCGAGSGITPLMAIVKSALAVGTRNVSLLYANRDAESVIFAAELDELLAAHADRFTVVHWLEQERGLPDGPALRSVLAPMVDGREAFLCGPAPFMDVVSDVLNDLGVPHDHVHREVFTSINGDPFLSVTPLVDDSDGGGAALAVVELEGTTYRLRWPTDTPLLEVLLAEGIDAPFSCQQGSCSACACFVQAGSTEMICNEVLDEDDLASGQVLACQLLPKSDVVEIRYED